MRRRRSSRAVHTSQERHYLERRGKPPLIDERITRDLTGKVLSYSLTFVDFTIFNEDNGRVLGYDNGHGIHERHFLGMISIIPFTSYEAMATRFFEEVDRIRTEGIACLS